MQVFVVGNFARVGWELNLFMEEDFVGDFKLFLEVDLDHFLR